MKRITICLSLLLFPLFIVSAAMAPDAPIIASYQDCWEQEPPPGWQILTNSRGSMGDAGNYEPLAYVNESPEKWVSGATYYIDENKAIRVGPANSRIRGVRDGVKQYAICAYTFLEDLPGDVWVTQGNIQGRNQGVGMDLKVYLNNTLKLEQLAPVAREADLFQCNLGAVKKGDVVYVAFASEDVNTLIVRLFYTIEAYPQGTVPPPPPQKIHPAPDAATPVLSSRTVRPDPKYLEQHEKLCEALLAQKSETVFIGDSITVRLGSGAMLSSRFGEKFKPGMFAISGDWMQNVLWRILNGVFDRLKPKAIVLLIGTNNISQYTEDEITRGIDAILQALRQQTPDSHIVVMGIFPRGESIHNNPGYEKIKQVNANLADLAAKDDKVFFLDIGSRLVEPDGTIADEIMPDRLHVATKGLDIWAEALIPVLDKFFENP